MSGWIESLILTFIPLFIVIDPLGNVPFVISMSEGLAPLERRKLIFVAVLTAVMVGLVFLFFGKVILDVMGISFGSFAIAGGIILLVLSIRHMTTGHMVELIREEMMAVVPIGTPLTVGPATITTLLLLVAQYPLYIVLLSFMLNMALTWLIFLASNKIVRFAGQGGVKAISRIFSLLLAAIAVSMIIRGLALLGVLQNTTGLLR